MLALFDLGEEAGELKEAPFGANMAFRKEIVAKHGGFRTDLGPCPGSEIRNEDTEFGRRLMRSGERLRYEPSAIVHHPVPENRLKGEYFLAFWFAHGRASIRKGGKRSDIAGIPRHLFDHFEDWKPTAGQNDQMVADAKGERNMLDDGGRNQ